MTRERGTKVFDAEGKILGRLATELASVLRGKDQPTWVPYRDDGPVVIVTHTDRIKVTGTKRRTKIYHRHTQHKPGAHRMLTLGQRLERDSREVVRDAVFNMLPKNRLRHRMITRLKLFAGEASDSVGTPGGTPPWMRKANPKRTPGGAPLGHPIESRSDSQGTPALRIFEENPKGTPAEAPPSSAHRPSSP